MDSPWRIEMLGWLRATRGEQVVSRFRTHKTGALFAYLAYHPHRAHTRDALIEMLWPEDERESARAKLRQALASLRRQLEPPGLPAGAVILADRSLAGLNAAAVTTDVALFAAAVEAAEGATGPTERTQRLAEAVRLYRGELLPGYFEEWVLLERERLAEQFLQAVEALIGLLKECGDLTRAREYARRAVIADPLREEAQHELIQLLVATGEPAAALRQYQELERLLSTALGAEPAPETRSLVESVRGTAVGVPASTPYARTAGAPGRTRDSPSPLAADGARTPSPHPTGTVTFLAAEVVDTMARPDEAAPGAGQESAVGTDGGDLPSLGPDAAALGGLLRPMFRGHGGHEIHGAASSFCIAFGRASDALAATLAAQKAMQSWQWAGESGESVREAAGGDWADDDPVRRGSPGVSAYRLQHPAYRLRAALHVGELEPGEEIARSGALAQAQRVLVAAHPGQVLLSERCAVLLPSTAPIADLGLYRLREQDPAERLFQALDPGTSRHEFPPPLALPAHSGSLPLQFTRFFGREEELAALQALLRPEEWTGKRRVPAFCLVTLTGPGGTGKTRLALEAAARLRPLFGGAVWFVSLQELVDPRLIPDRLLEAMRLPQVPHLDPVEQVVAFLSAQPSLLVLDNFEQLLSTARPSAPATESARGAGADGASLVQTLLQRAPLLTCLVTSRQRLNLAGEREVAVAPLAVPGDSRQSTVDSDDLKLAADPSSVICRLSTVPSVALFLDRARAVMPDFQVTAGNAAAIARLCARLEGIPLALELAAARSKLLAPAQILARLDQRFALLVNRSRDAAPRHGSLWAALDWSYQLLSPELQRFFARLSVFRGGWTLEDAETVCGDAGVQAFRPSGLQDGSVQIPERLNARTPERPSPVLDFLEQLQECSMVVASGGRFRMLETLREYGAEQLSTAEQEALEGAHAEHFLALAERAAPELVSEAQGEWMDRLEVEHDNLRAALRWLMEQDEVEKGLRLGTALGRFWMTRGHGAEGTQWLEALLTMPGTERCAAERGEALHPAVMLTYHWGDPEAARRLSVENVAATRARGDRRGLAEALSLQGDAALWNDGPAAVQALYEESLGIARELGDAWTIAVSLCNVAQVRLGQGDIRSATRLYKESLEIWRSLGDRRGVADALSRLGTAAGLAGEYPAAQRLHEESLAVLHELEYRQGIAGVLNDLGSLALAQGEQERARAYFEQSLAIHGAAGDRWGTGEVLLGLGELALLEGDMASARSLTEQCLAQYRELGNRARTARVLRVLGRVARSEGNREQAAALYQECLSLRAQRNERLGIAESLEGLAELAADTGRAERAARLLGAADALRAELGTPVPALEQPTREVLTAALRAALGDAGFAEAGAAGRSLPLDRAVAVGLMR